MDDIALKLPSECRLLIVDDEQSICDFLRTGLEGKYQHAETCFNAKDAIKLLDSYDFDVIIVDLRLPDMSGIEVMRYAKQKDEYIEVIIITGYASIESAAEAINLGVSSYLLKPLSLNEFLVQVERAVAIRIFHLKSRILMRQTERVVPEVKGHLQDITTLYYFLRKVMSSLDIAETMRVILDEANDKFDSVLCVIGINFLGFREVYAMPRAGLIKDDYVRMALLTEWHSTYDILDKESFKVKEIPVIIYDGDTGGVNNGWGTAVTLPLSILGKMIGFLTVFSEKEKSLEKEKSQFLYVFTSMISSVIEHGYLDMQAKLQAKTDSLTGVANHRMFHETLEREIARSNRNGQEFCLAMMDIDDFKKINDTHGHLVGDAVLIDITTRISARIRRGDVLCRYGGEEFALILPDTDEKGGGILASRICRDIASFPMTFSEKEVSYTVSIGISIYDGACPRQKDLLIGDADEALYRSKREGKNRVTINNGNGRS